MSAEEIKNRLNEILEGKVAWIENEAGDPSGLVPSKHWHEVCRTVHDDPELSCEYMRSLCGIDLPEEKSIEVVAHLFNYSGRHPLVLRTRVDRENPVLESVADVWPAANFHERECYDLLGVKFEGHPDLRRLLLPDDWEGHPLRKDYQEKESYHGIPTTRPGYEKKAVEEEKKEKE
jgi:NADH-quinone oxidoreductase subunit C